jgi:hypothetical protein
MRPIERTGSDISGIAVHQQSDEEWSLEEGELFAAEQIDLSQIWEGSLEIDCEDEEWIGVGEEDLHPSQKLDGVESSRRGIESHQNQSAEVMDPTTLLNHTLPSEFALKVASDGVIFFNESQTEDLAVAWGNHEEGENLSNSFSAFSSSSSASSRSLSSSPGVEAEEKSDLPEEPVDESSLLEEIRSNREQFEIVVTPVLAIEESKRLSLGQDAVSVELGGLSLMDRSPVSNFSSQSMANPVLLEQSSHQELEREGRARGIKRRRSSSHHEEGLSKENLERWLADVTYPAALPNPVGASVDFTGNSPSFPQSLSMGTALIPPRHSMSCSHRHEHEIFRQDQEIAFDQSRKLQALPAELDSNFFEPSEPIINRTLLEGRREEMDESLAFWNRMTEAGALACRTIWAALAGCTHQGTGGEPEI